MDTGSAARRTIRLRSSGAHVVMLIAPAGYGKTTAALALAAEYTNRTICDLTGAADAHSFMRAVLLALGRANPQDDETVPQASGEFSRAGSDEDRQSILENAWAKESQASLFIFENTEAISAEPTLSSLLTRLLITAPSSRRLVICSRTPLQTRAGRYLPPHRLSTLTTKDFAMDDEEAAGLLEREGVDAPARERIIAAARGWPIILLLLARLAREGRLEEALLGTEGTAFDDLFVYLLGEVLEPLDEGVKRFMQLCASVPAITAAEIRTIMGQTDLDLRALVRNAPLITREGDLFTMHPFVRELFLKDTSKTQECALLVARIAEEAQDNLRACKLYRMANDASAAANSLSRLSVEDLQSGESAYELLQIPLGSLCVHRKLVAAAAIHRPDVTDPMLRQALEALCDDDDPVVVASVAHQVCEGLDDMDEISKVLDSPLVMQAAQLSETARALRTEAKLFFPFQCAGAGISIESGMRQAYEIFRSRQMPLERIRLAYAISQIRGAAGDTAGVLEWTDIALEQCRRFSASMHATMLLCGIFETWARRMDSEAAGYRRELEEIHMRTGDHAYARALQALDPQTVDLSLPLWFGVVDSYVLMMAASQVEGDGRRKLLESAAGVIVPSVRTKALLAQAAADPHMRGERCREVLALIDPNEMPEYYDAVQSYAARRQSFLDPFLARFDPGTVSAPKPAVERAGLRLEVLHERLVVDHEAIRLTPREAAFLTYLTRARSGASREQIQDALWPDLEERPARDSLYSLLHRLRKRTGRAEIVEGIGSGYRLGASVEVDIWELDQLAQRLQREATPDLMSRAERVYDACSNRVEAHIQEYDWFSTIQFRVHEHVRVLARHLAECAKAAGDSAAVLRYANNIISEEPCDEWAHQTIVREYLSRNEFAEASRAYRNYCLLLEKEIGAKPSEEMRSLAASAQISPMALANAG